MSVQTKAQLLRLVASLERQNKKLRKRIAELEGASTAVNHELRDTHGAVTARLPRNPMPWECS